MVDPFGCIAVAEPALRLIVKVGRLIRDLQAAPDQLFAFSNEIYDLKLSLDSVHQALSSQRRPLQVPSIEPFLFQASIRFEEIDKIVSRPEKLGPYGSKWKVRAWEGFVWHREKDKIATMQKHLRELRTNIALALGANCL